MIGCDGGMLEAPGLFSSHSKKSIPPEGAHGDITLEEVERAHIRRVLEGTRWVIEGEHGAARILGLNPSTLRGRLRKLGLRKSS